MEDVAVVRSDPTRGQVIAGRYELISLCGKGGMGSVWRARPLASAPLVGRTECAVKILHRAAPDRIPHLAERFMREARVASAIDSPNAVRVLDYGVDGGLPFIVMELLEGETLAARLRRSRPMSGVETFAIIEQVANALSRAQEIGVVHRDLKPDNVFLSRSSGDTVVAKVLDFGIAKVLDEETISRELTETGALLGTPHYMSPEQIDGARYVDHRTDLWSLGVIAFECITGQRPFQGDGLRAVVLAICVHERPSASSLCEVPSGFDAWFSKCTNTDPTKRFRSAPELSEALGKVCGEAVPTSNRADTLVDEGVTEDDSASMDSRSGSMAVPRIASESQALLAEPGSSELRLALSRLRRSRLRSFWPWGVSVLLLLAGAAWLSVRNQATKATPNIDSLVPSHSAVNAEPAPLPHVSARVETPVPSSAASNNSSAPRPEPRKQGSARTFRGRSASEMKAPPPTEMRDAPAPAPSALPAPSAKPAQWNYDEMLKDRK